MQVQSIECTLTQAQMKRYLAGADFPDEILAALERHLKVCPDCMAAANQQREALGGAPAEVGQAVVATSSASPLDRLKGLFTRKPKASTPPPGLIGAPGENPYADPLAVFKTPKNLVLSGSLAIVLVLMSTVMRDPTGLFGPRAASAITSEPVSNEDAPAESKAAVVKEQEPVASAASHEDESSAHEAKEPLASKPAAKSPPPVKKAVPESVGGDVLIVDSAAPAKPPKSAARTAVTPKASKPATKPKAQARRTSVRKVSAPRVRNRVTVYMPDGTVKRP